MIFFERRIAPFLIAALAFIPAFFLIHQSCKFKRPSGKRLQLFFKDSSSIKDIKFHCSGFSNNLWRIETERPNSRSYILRSPKIKNDPKHFDHLKEVTVKAGLCGIGAKVVGIDSKEQEFLLEYIEQRRWPAYRENSEPYLQTARLLGAFHDEMTQLPIDRTFYSPFQWILREGERLKKEMDLPDHLSIALQRIEKIFLAMRPWLERNAKLCHGDFHQSNVLLTKENEKYRAYLIDFDSLTWGHPYFDLCKFSLSLSNSERYELFCAYLGGRAPTLQEKTHFEMVDLVLRMVVAIVRFNSAQNSSNKENDLSNSEMNYLLEKEDLPSFLSLPFSNSSSRARKLGAIYALADFLKKTDGPIFEKWLTLL